MLLLATVALTGCRIAEHGRRAAIDAFASFVLDSVFQMQKAAPLTEKAPQLARTEPAAPKSECPLAAAKLPNAVVTVTVPLPLPVPQPRIAAIDLAPATEACRVKRVYAFAHVRPMVNLEARMALAQLRGIQAERVRRVVVVVEPDPEPDPATL